MARVEAHIHEKESEVQRLYSALQTASEKQALEKANVERAVGPGPGGAGRVYAGMGKISGLV